MKKIITTEFTEPKMVQDFIKKVQVPTEPVITQNYSLFSASWDTTRVNKKGVVTKPGHVVNFLYIFANMNNEYTTMLQYNIDTKVLNEPKNYLLSINDAIIQYNTEYIASQSLKLTLDNCYYPFLYEALIQKHQNETWVELMSVCYYAIGVHKCYNNVYFNFTKEQRAGVRSIINKHLYQQKNHSSYASKQYSYENMLSTIDGTKKIEYTNMATTETYFSDLNAVEFFNEVLGCLSKQEKRVLKHLVSYELDETIARKMNLSKPALTRIKNAIQTTGDAVLRENGVNILIATDENKQASTVKRCRNDIKVKTRQLQLENGDAVTVRRSTCKKHNR